MKSFKITSLTLRICLTLGLFLILFSGIGYANSVYPFISDYTSGNIMPTTSSSLLNNISVYNSTWLDFDGTNDKIQIPDFIPATGTISDKLAVSFWFNPELNVTNKRILGKENQFLFLWNGGKIRFAVYNDSTLYALDSVTLPSMNTWINVIGDFNGSRTRIFINGVIDNSGTADAVKGLNSTNLQNFSIGGVLTSYQNGSMDEVIVFNDSLTTSQVARVYNSSLKRNGESIAVLNYHQIDDTPNVNTVVNITEFTEQMQYLYDNNSTTITYKDILNASFLLPNKPVILSFDDGMVNVYTNATPIMDSFGFKGVMAIITDSVGTGQFMTWTQINDLKNKGWEIASHSINGTSFLNYSSITRNELFQNSRDSINNNISGYNVTTFIFPGGYRNTTTDNECANYYSICGAEALTWSSARFVYKNSNLTSTIPRMSVYNDTTISEFEDMVDYKSKILLDMNFNENNGTTAYDSSGNNNNGVISGATWNNDGIKVPLLSSQYSLSGNQFNLLDYYLDKSYAEMDYDCITLSNDSKVNFTDVYCANTRPLNITTTSSLIYIKNWNDTQSYRLNFSDLGTYNDIFYSNQTSKINNNENEFNLTIAPNNITCVYSYNENDTRITQLNTSRSCSNIGYLNLTKGWNLIPQWDSTSHNFSELANSINNSLLLSNYDTISKTFIPFVKGIAINANYTINSTKPFYVYVTTNTTFSFFNLAYNLRTRENATIYNGWNLLYNINASLNISQINQTLGKNISIISYWNNTDKKYYSAVIKFNINYNIQIPMMESYFIYTNQSNNFTWSR